MKTLRTRPQLRAMSGTRVSGLSNSHLSPFPKLFADTPPPPPRRASSRSKSSPRRNTPPTAHSHAFHSLRICQRSPSLVRGQPPAHQARSFTAMSLKTGAKRTCCQTHHSASTRLTQRWILCCLAASHLAKTSTLYLFPLQPALHSGGSVTCRIQWFCMTQTVLHLQIIHTSAAPPAQACLIVCRLIHCSVQRRAVALMCTR
jgi:hypothetical protein